MAASERKRRLGRLDQYKEPAYRELVARLARNLRAVRSQLQLTQEQAAERCGMSVRYFQALEGREKNFTATTLARLAKGLGVDPSQLIQPLKRP